MKNSSNNVNKTTAKEIDQKAIAGIKKYFANVSKITVESTDYTPATLTAQLQAEIDAVTALDAGRAQFRQQVADTKKVRVTTRRIRSVIRKYIVTTYGPEALQMLEDFGMKVPKNTSTRTPEEKAKAVAKAKATREAKKKALESVTSAPTAGAVATVSTTPSK